MKRLSAVSRIEHVLNRIRSASRALGRLRVAERLEHPLHPLGVVLVHLAAERRQVVAQLSARRRHRGAAEYPRPSRRERRTGDPPLASSPPRKARGRHVCNWPSRSLRCPRNARTEDHRLHRARRAHARRARLRKVDHWGLRRWVHGSGQDRVHLPRGCCLRESQRAIGARGGPPRSDLARRPGSDGPAGFRAAEKIVRDAIAELEAIPVPEGDQAAVSKIIHALGTTADTLGDEATASAKHDANALFKADQAGSSSGAVYKRLARAYGLKKCGTGA